MIDIRTEPNFQVLDRIWACSFEGEALEVNPVGQCLWFAKIVNTN